MPYIPKEDRIQYIPIIESTVNLVSNEKDKYVQLDYLGFFIDSLRQRFDRQPLRFRGEFLDVDKKKTLVKNVDTLETLLLSKKDLFVQAGELNYVISAVLWGIMGDSLHADSARYGFRAFVKGILWTIYNSLDQCGSEWTKMHVMLRGVFTDIIDEMYRRKTSNYEDEKISQNGDVWPLRDVSWKEEVPFEIIASKIEEE